MRTKLTKAHVVKKLKLTGAPFKVYKNTAFIKEMFTSQLEDPRFPSSSSPRYLISSPHSPVSSL